ncbi:MAG: FAD-binding protein [Christensenellaceae bacterium]
MIKINNLKLPLDFTQDDLHDAVCALLKTSDFTDMKIVKQAIDARRKSNVHYVLSVCLTAKNEKDLLAQNTDATVYDAPVYQTAFAQKALGARPVVVGSGPCGLFCALTLAKAGLKPILLERGKEVDARTQDVEQFFTSGMLNENSNIQFGEGGAGTFSDGKLTTGTKDIRQAYILQEFAAAGAPSSILYAAKAHIGTDILRVVLKNMRAKLLSLGCDILFEHTFNKIITHNNCLQGIEARSLQGTVSLDTNHLVLAIGHSARDTFELLHQSGLEMKPKSFAVGVRIEHLQHSINTAQYGSFAEYKNIPAADYKLSCHLKNDRSAYTFCVCPGGSVVAAASSDGMLVTNGMSEFKRDGQNINGGFLVGVSPDDFESDHALSGMYYQMELEKQAFLLGGKNFKAPAQLVGDFINGVPSTKLGSVSPTYPLGVTLTDLHKCLPAYISYTLVDALKIFGNKIAGFDAHDALLTGVETRSSSPVRILRDESFCSSIKGVYPCGEGAGYAGGIMSAAADGIKCADAIIDTL